MSRVAIVTGAARGIGAAAVAALAADGWTVVAVDRGSDDPRLPYPMGSEAELHAVVEGVGAERASAVLADATDREQLARVVEDAESRHGGVDAVVVAAGVIGGGVPLWEMALEEEAAVLDVNLGGTLTAARVGIPAMLRRPAPRQGRFIAVASSAASRGLPLLAAYCAAKAGVTGLIRALGSELRGTGITANAVSPGSTRTPILEESARLYGLAGAEAFAVQQPIERLLHPEEVAALVAWLAGSAGSGITGADFPIDGGLSL